MAFLALVAIREPRLGLVVKPSVEAMRMVTLVAPGNTAVNDEALLLDPTPLFLPTKWNAAQRTVTPPEAGGRFQGFDAPRYGFSESELRLGLPAPIALPAGAPEAVAAEAMAIPLVGWGRKDGAAEALPPRGGVVEIFGAGTGQKIFRQIVDERPPGGTGWQPIEFVAGVDAAGMLGPLVLTVRSGVEEVDFFFTNYLTRTLRVGQRLAPGFYRIHVGP